MGILYDTAARFLQRLDDLYGDICDFEQDDENPDDGPDAT